MSVTFASHHRGGVVAVFGGSKSSGDLDTIAIDLMPGLSVDNVITFEKNDTPGWTSAAGLAPTELSAGRYAVANGVAVYTVTAVGATDYTVQRGNS